MANIKVKNRSQRKIRRIIAVDVWRSSFGEHSVNAIYKLHAQLFEIDRADMRKYTFAHCVDALRSLEDPTYTPRRK